MQNLSFLVGHNIQILESVDSTNNYIAKHADAQKMTDGTVIMAKYQSQGKGRTGKTWKAKADENLTFSFLIHPKKINASQQFYLNKWVCSALCMWLQDLGLKPRIKLPNDIYIGQKKICGILIENTWQKNEIKRSIIGIGINVNQSEFEGDFAATPTSIFLETGEQHHPETALNKLLSFLSYYFSLSSDSNKVDDTFFHFLALDYELNHPDTGIQNGKLLSIDNSGELNFQLKEGKSLNVNLEQVKLKLLQ